MARGIAELIPEAIREEDLEAARAMLREAVRGGRSATDGQLGSLEESARDTAAAPPPGARTAITSLWKVDDAATRRLFELFYSKLWRDNLGKADALWQAKMALRAEGHPPRDWAGWVLSGDPD